MNTVLEIPKLISSVVLEPPLTDEEFEKLCMSTESVKLERSKEGKIIVNPPAGLDSSSGNIEISRQLANWWCEHQKGRVFDSSAGFFLPDGSSLSPDGAYATAEQMCGLSREDRKRFGRFAPAFVIELRSATDNLSESKKKMETWMQNGSKLGWLIDPYERKVWVYEPGKPPRSKSGNKITGTDPVEGFVLDLEAVWSYYQD